MSGGCLGEWTISLTSRHPLDIAAHDKFYQDFSVCYYSNKVQMWQSHAESNIIQRVLNAVLCSKRYSAELLLRAGAHMHYVDEPRNYLGYSALNVVMRSKCAVE